MEPEPLAVRSYTAFASNNSGSYTLVGSFKTSQRADDVASIPNALATEMAVEDRDSNPVQDLLRKAGLPAPDEVAGYDDWPDISYSSSPEAVSVAKQVWWYCDYTISMPSELAHWFYAMGGKVDSKLDHTHHPQLEHPLAGDHEDEEHGREPRSARGRALVRLSDQASRHEDRRGVDPDGPAPAIGTGRRRPVAARHRSECPVRRSTVA